MRVAFVAAAAAAIGLAFLGGGRAAQPTAGVALRVDQLGYLPDEAKIAYLLAPAAKPGAEFAVVDGNGRTVLRGRAGANRGAWNARYGAVQPLDLTALRRPGTYRVELQGTGAVSPWFRVAAAASLLTPRVADAVAFFQAQRDGADVIAGQLHRRPAHLHDAHLSVYAWPRYESPDSDVILGSSLKRIGGPLDLEGGWMDAGDFVKFTHTTAYAADLLLVAQRTLGRAAPPTLAPEARFGLSWLGKAWDARSGVMALQVGIGSGNKAGTFFGDHDVWRLPEKDDGLTGSKNRYLRNRPAFVANDPGKPLPPNLAGRVAAAFALAAQLDAKAAPDRARSELATAAEIFAHAKTSNVRSSDVVTALPHAFYPESSWQDDLELAGAELALAGRALGDPRAGGWLRAGAHWAAAYLGPHVPHDTLNLYDTSALAHAELVQAMRSLPAIHGLEVSQTRLLASLSAQLDGARARAPRDPFGAAAVYDNFDAAPHTFGLVATAELYRRLTGDQRYDAFAAEQRGWALGANAWGASLMIGVGTSFPHCPQHVVANLSGRLDGRPPYLRDAVVNGPNDAGLFTGGLGEFFSSGRRCPDPPADPYAQFTGHGSRYVDDVRSWQTVEPALDFTATALLAFALA